MEQYIPKSALVAEIEKLKNELKASDCAAYKEAYIIGAEHTIKTISDVIDTLEVIEIGVDLGDPKGDKSAKYIIDTNSLEVKEVDLEDAKKEEFAQKYVDYTFKRHNIDPESKEGQLIYYAYMHGMNQCLEKLKAQKGEDI